MATGQKDLARTIIDILGEEQVIELMGVDRLVAGLEHFKPQVARLNEEQRLSFLKTLMPGLSEKELKDLLAASDTKTAGKSNKKKVPSHDKKD